MDYKIISPNLDTPLVKKIFELQELRSKRLTGNVQPFVFFQIKEIFLWLESLSSARIEGNGTTIAEIIEEKISKNPPNSDERYTEISNIQNAINRTEQYLGTEGGEITSEFIFEVHKILTKGLSNPTAGGEGSRWPGEYRKCEVDIKKSHHKPPHQSAVLGYMLDLIENIKKYSSEKHLDLINLAIAHHRFVWIHPFDNGNGRAVRILTYGMLIRSGYKVQIGGGILNPAAIFCVNRDKYCEMLGKADSGTDKDLEAWCDYVVSGLLDEIKKIDKLLDYNYVTEKILMPSITHSHKQKFLNDIEFKILKLCVEKMEITNSDIGKIVLGKTQNISYYIRELRKKGYLSPLPKNSRKYYLNFIDNNLLRSVVYHLQLEGFVPLKDKIQQ